jgi:uncharacterized glyoxalase superfamily protein PhnB
MNLNIRKITPVLLVEEAEPCLRFWVERLGFEKLAEVPHEGKVGFAILQKDGLELMYQTFSSVAADHPDSAAAGRQGPAFLFLEVDTLDDIISAIEGAPVVMPVRTTFYGSREIVVTDPHGHVITFAEFPPAPEPLK